MSLYGRQFRTGVDLVNQRVQRMADGVSATDAVTLQQMQAFVRGLSWKQPVRAAATTNVSLTSPGATMDGVTLASGDRVLLPAQTSPAETGIYLYSGVSSPLVRTADADTPEELLGASVLVREGTTNADRQFNQTVDTITAVGTTALTWVEFGGATIYTAGNGLAISGRQFSVTPGLGILSTGAGVAVDTSVVARKFAATIAAGATTANLDHGLNTPDVLVQLREVGTGEVIDADVTVSSATRVVVGFAVALPAAVRAVILG